MITDTATDRTPLMRWRSARTNTTTPKTISTEAGTSSHLKMIRTRSHRLGWQAHQS
jgi:hypothetical protein